MRAHGVLLVVAVALVLAMLPQEVMDSDPAQYADVARRIAQSGDWLDLRDMNGPFVNKPPLVMQAEAVGLLALGPGSSVAARLPAVLAFLLTLVGTWWLAAQRGGASRGADAAVLLACSVAAHHMVADPKVDFALTAFVTLGVAAWCQAAASGRAGWLVLAWACAGLAVLSKGPVGLALVAGAVGPEALRARRLGPTWAHLFGLGVFAGLTAPFYMASLAGGGGARLWFLLWAQGPGRLLGGSQFHDATTPLYVLHTAAWALLPMSAVLLAMAAQWVRERLRRQAQEAAPAWALVPQWWLATGLGAVAVASFKLPQYVYWAAPAAAVLAADGLGRAPRWVPVALAAAGGVLGVALLVVAFPPGPVEGLLLGAMLLAAVGVTLSGWPPAVRFGASALGFLACFDLWIHPALLDFQPWREVGTAVRAADPAGPVVQFCEVAPTFAADFYLWRTIKAVAEEELGSGLAVVSPSVRARLGSRAREVGRWPSYRVSLPRWPFLRAATRAQAISWVEVVWIDGESTAPASPGG